MFDRKWNNLAPDGSIETVAWRTPTLPPPNEPTTCGDPNATNFAAAALHIARRRHRHRRRPRRGDDDRCLSGEGRDRGDRSAAGGRSDGRRRHGAVESECQQSESCSSAVLAGELRGTDIRGHGGHGLTTCGCASGRKTIGCRTIPSTCSSAIR